MKCFNHHEIDAIGSCKSCSKGLCVNCVTDLSHGLACKGVHEQQVEDLNALIIRNVKIQAIAGKNKYLGPVFFLFMGVVMFSYAFTSDQGLDNSTVLIGLGFIVFGIAVFITNHKAYKKAENQTE